MVPNPVPVIVTGSAVFPAFGVTAVTLSPEETVKLMPLLAVPPAETMMLPVVAPAGTEAAINPSLQLVGTAVVPLNLMVLDP